jgi:hypothetical protein
MDVRIDSGMETAMISVLRQLPRNSRIMAPVRQAAIIASRTTPLMARARKSTGPPAVESSVEAVASVGRAAAMP